jgi:hypothetical protein
MEPSGPTILPSYRKLRLNKYLWYVAPCRLVYSVAVRISPSQPILLTGQSSRSNSLFFPNRVLTFIGWLGKMQHIGCMSSWDKNGFLGFLSLT